VWVYGDPAVYDPVREYTFAPDVAAKVRYTGYFDQRARFEFGRGNGKDPAAVRGLPPGRLALCLVGGGQDGAELAKAFVEAELPPDTNGLLVTGPCMPAGVRRRLVRSVASNPCRRVVSVVHEPTRLVGRADRVVAMGGYNTVYEVLSFDKPALIVPRVKPRREQLIRAERLQALGLVDVLHPEALSAAALSTWLARGRAPVRPARERIAFNGPSRIPQLLEGLLGIRPPLRPRRRVRAEVHHAACRAAARRGVGWSACDRLHRQSLAPAFRDLHSQRDRRPGAPRRFHLHFFREGPESRSDPRQRCPG